VAIPPKKRSKPLYWQVVEDISAQIEAGTWRPGDKLPSERVLCKMYRVSQITIRRALRELAHLGRVYSHHGVGWFVSDASLSGVRPQVGLFVSSWDRLMGRFIWHLAKELAQAGMDLCLLPEPTPAGETEVLLFAVAGREQEVNAHYAQLSAQKASALFLLRGLNEQAPAAILDERLGMEQITRHILSMGHHRVAYLGLDPALLEGQLRYRGFVEVLWEHGLELPLDWVFADLEREGERFLRVFRPGYGPTALVCASDLQAARAMGMLQEVGLRCPDDVAIVGLGDEEFAAFLPTPLTTFRFDLLELARRVAMLCLAFYEGREVENVRVAGELVVRQSCGASQRA